MVLNDLKYLKIELPEDISKLKSVGNFSKAVEVIDMRLKKDIPLALRKRLELEKLIISGFELNYPYTYDEALRILEKNIKDFNIEELEKYKDMDAVDWIFVDGEVRFQRLFYDNLIKTRPNIAKRLLVATNTEDANKNQKLLDDNVEIMKENKKTAYYFHLKCILNVEDDFIIRGKVIKVHLPIPNNSKQVKNVKIISTVPESKLIAPFDYPSRTAYFETDLKDNNEFSVEYSYEMHMEYNELDASKVSTKQPTFDTYELEPHIMFTPYIKELAKEIVGDEKNPLLKARKIYDFITKNIMYSYVRNYFSILNISEYAALNLKGDCGVQAILFITLCRYVAVPAKWQSGLYVTPYTVSGHDWAQFYIEPYGWLFADLSFGGSAFRNDKIERWNFYFGNLDPFRMVANSEFQYEFNPPKNQMRYDPTDNQYGECEYDDRPLRKEEYESEYTLIEARKLY